VAFSNKWFPPLVRSTDLKKKKKVSQNLNQKLVDHKNLMRKLIRNQFRE